MAQRGNAKGRAGVSPRRRLAGGALHLGSAVALAGVWAFLGGNASPATAQAEQLSAGILGWTSSEDAAAAALQLQGFREQLDRALNERSYRGPGMFVRGAGSGRVFADAAALTQDVRELHQAVGLFLSEVEQRDASPWARAFTVPLWRALQGLEDSDAPAGGATSPWVPAVEGIGRTLALAVLAGRKGKDAGGWPRHATPAFAGMVAELTLAATLRGVGLRPRALEPGLQVPWDAVKSTRSLPRDRESLLDMVLWPLLDGGGAPVLVEAKTVNGRVRKDPWETTVAGAASELASTLGRIDRQAHARLTDHGFDEAVVRARNELKRFFEPRLPSVARGANRAKQVLVLGVPSDATPSGDDPYPALDRALQGRTKTALIVARFSESSAELCQLALAIPGKKPPGGKRYLDLTPTTLSEVLCAPRAYGPDSIPLHLAGKKPGLGQRSNRATQTYPFR